MKLRVSNNGESTLTVVLEPWATEFEVAKGDFIEFRLAGRSSPEACWLIQHSTYGVLVWAEGVEEGEAGIVSTYDSEGHLLD